MRRLSQYIFLLASCRRNNYVVMVLAHTHSAYSIAMCKYVYKNIQTWKIHVISYVLSVVTDLYIERHLVT